MSKAISIPPQANLLLACLQADKTIDPDHLAHISSSEWQSLVDLARVQGVLPILYYRLKEKKMGNIVPSEIWQQLTRKYRRTTLRNMKLLRELHRIVKALDEVGIPVVALKGAYLIPIVYPDVGLRSMSDLDLLIPIGDISQAAAIVEALGYQFPRKLDNHDFQFSQFYHLPRMVKKGATYVELHGYLTKLDESWSCDAHIWWQEIQTVEIVGSPVKVLNSINQILHLCIHISYHHRFHIDLKHYYDLVVLLQFLGFEIDWEELLQRAHLYGWEKGVLMVLKITQNLFSITLPKRITDQLKPEKDCKKFFDFALSEMWASSNKKTAFFSTEVAEYQFQIGIWAKINYIRQRIFISKRDMAQQHPVSADSLLIYPYYLVRIKDQLYKHFKTLRQISRGDSETTATATKKYELWHWLDGERR